MSLGKASSSNGLRPSRKEVAAYYASHRGSFYLPERISVAHIVKNVDARCDRGTARHTIEQARAELLRGESFRSVAARYSDCGAPGEIPFFSRGLMVAEFEEAVFPLAPGETTKVFETVFGFHLVRLLERRPAGVAPLSEMYEEICELIRSERLQTLAHHNR